MNAIKSSLDELFQKRWVTHALFWIGFGALFILLGVLNTGTIKQHLFNYTVLLPAQMLATYCLVYYQIPKLLFKKKYLLFMLSLVASIYFFAALARWSIVYIAEPFLRVDYEQETLFEILTDPIYLLAIYIQKEVDWMKDYIELERLRYGTKLDLTFDYELDNPKAPIAPLIILPIIENAFKHGASVNPTNPLILIDLKVLENVLKLKVFNTKGPALATQPGTKVHAGIGESNVKRQLALNYPSAHKLDINETNESYSVNLQIELN